MDSVRIYQDQGYPALVAWDWTDFDTDFTAHLEVLRIREGHAPEQVLERDMRHASVLPYGSNALMMQPMSFGAESPVIAKLANGQVEVQSFSAEPKARPGQLFLQVKAHTIGQKPQLIELEDLPSHLSVNLHGQIVLTSTDESVELFATLDREHGDPGGFYHYEPAPYRNCLVLETEEKGNGVLVLSTEGSEFLVNGQKKPFVSIPITIS